MESKKNIDRYFAAANGYSGFRSYFQSLFDSKDFARIIVLKGGPGTGKSSFMKRARAELADRCEEAYEILCSSDPQSLDGIIFSGEGGRVAIIDGTAPHERDAVIPGAIDEIVNLGDAWDERWLSSQREKILELCEHKKRAYGSAYSYLGISGKIDDFVCTSQRTCIDTQGIRKLVRKIADEEKNGGKKEVRLIGSFGKSGVYRVKTFEKKAKKIHSVVGNKRAVEHFFKSLSDELSYQEKAYVLSPSPLSERVTDAIYLSDSRRAFLSYEGGEIIDVDRFVTSSDPISKEEVRVAGGMYDTAIKEAIRWFSVAADMHFRLEEIYTRTMEFEKINAIYEKEIENIKNILGLEG